MSSLTGMLPLVLMFVVLYFVMIRPQMKRQEHRAMIDALAGKDEVATAGGIIGKVTRLSEGFRTSKSPTTWKCRSSAAPWCKVLPKGGTAK